MKNEFSDMKGIIKPVKDDILEEIFRKMDEAEVSYNKLQEIKEEASISK